MSNKAGVIPFIVKDGKVLMMFMKSSDPEYGGAAPQIAKGSLDKGETPKAGAMREAEEELGLRKSNLDSELMLVWHASHEGQDAEYAFSIYVVRVKSQEDFGEFHFETESVHWMTLDEFAARGRKSQLGIVTTAATFIDRISR